MLYDIRLKLSHQYTETITGGRHRLCIEPLELPEVQNILASKISSHPEPTEKSEYFDLESMLKFIENNQELLRINSNVFRKWKQFREK